MSALLSLYPWQRDVLRFYSRSLPDLIAATLSPAELAQQTEKKTERMNPDPSALKNIARNMAAAAKDIEKQAKTKPVKPTAPKLNEVRISTSANGFIVDGPKVQSYDPFVPYGFPQYSTTQSKPLTFESLNSLVAWLRKSIARPDAQATA
jgi:hypothetical protein